ncbi:MAG: hemerythrin domain-containing protein [Actinomycetota bacterium]|nr:hemerythrin domain-containing protein [Actinomycetota bacterium]
MATGISDNTIMNYVIHDALRRDLEHLTRAVETKAAFDPRRQHAFTAGWELFKSQLHIHHTGEDDALWPRVRSHLEDRPEDLALLEVMEQEHALIGPTIQDIDAALAEQESGADRLAEATAVFRRELVDHLAHEERDAVPLIESVMTAQDWKAFTRHQQKSASLKDAAEFFPYILSGADPERGAQALGKFPPPLRLLIRRVWQPRYRRRDLWG